MKRKLIVSLIIVILIFILVLIFGFIKNDKFDYTIKFDGKEYLYLDYRDDTFYYDLNNSYDFEVDEVSKIEHDKWDIVYFNGDVFVAKDKVNEAIKYYSNDSNYEWYLVIDEEEGNINKKISINNDELEYLYDIDNKKRDKAIPFNDIEKFGSIRKVSVDGFIFGSMSICYYDGHWYWKSEIMADDDKEYIVELPKSLNSKF